MLSCSLSVCMSAIDLQVEDAPPPETIQVGDDSDQDGSEEDDSWLFGEAGFGRAAPEVLRSAQQVINSARQRGQGEQLASMQATIAEDIATAMDTGLRPNKELADAYGVPYPQHCASSSNESGGGSSSSVAPALVAPIPSTELRFALLQM